MTWKIKIELVCAPGESWLARLIARLASRIITWVISDGPARLEVLKQALVEQGLARNIEFRDGES